MQKPRSIPNSVAGRAAMVAGCALAADGVLQVFHSQRSAGSRVVGLAGNVNLVFVIIALLALVPTFVALARYGRPTKAVERAGWAAAAGVLLVAVGSLTSIINQHDLSVFPLIAGPANVAWLVGMVVMAISLKRAGRVPTVVAIGLPVSYICTIPLATFGGGLGSGAYFLAVGYLLVNDAIDRRTVMQTVGAH